MDPNCTLPVEVSNVLSAYNYLTNRSTKSQVPVNRVALPLPRHDRPNIIREGSRHTTLRDPNTAKGRALDSERAKRCSRTVSFGQSTLMMWFGIDTAMPWLHTRSARHM
ncbi:hypothetical protein EVAR_43904_1 [Eumeta japonica]|uniref:Uncharacterized protein n=1 Tax=Eumeta variegata TaxID=151549 RepID=A0A4C1WNY9_EUMVA|nr:hypothetical protein EVAR_43904_1 [Eumeta japonica]